MVSGASEVNGPDVRPHIAFIDHVRGLRVKPRYVEGKRIAQSKLHIEGQEEKEMAQGALRFRIEGHGGREREFVKIETYSDVYIMSFIV